jgi:hypothetical protein
MAMEIPRLAAIASGFEEFRFQTLRIAYVPGCPATRSGVVMAAYVEDPLAQDPLGAVEFRAYETSFVSSVGREASSKVEVEDQKIWWLIHPVSVGISETFRDPTRRFQGKVVVATTGSESADNHALAGFLVLEYTVHLKSLRPARSLFLLLGNDPSAPETFTGGGSTNVINWPRLQWQEGEFGWEDSVAVRPDTDQTYDSTWLLEAGAWLLDFVFTLGAAASVDRVKSPRSVIRTIRPKLWRDGKSYNCQGLVAGTLFYARPDIDDQALFCLDKVSADDDEKSATYALNRDLEPPLPLSFAKLILAPMAAGDVVVTVHGQPVSATSATKDTLMTTTFALGTGAVTLEDVTRVTTTQGYVAHSDLVPTGTEARTASSGLTNHIGWARRQFSNDSA